MTTAFLVRTSISIWTARKKDKEATRAAKNAAGADDKANVAVYKSVIASKALDDIEKIASAARGEHKRRTVPWAYDGPGLITADGWPAYKAAMAELERSFNATVTHFYTVYDREREAAREYLGHMFNPNDYPTTDSLRTRFNFAVHCEPVPDAAHFRVQGLDPWDAVEIKKDIEANVNQAFDDANKTAWGRVIEVVEKLKLKMEAYKPGAKGVREENGFHATLITNIEELVTLIPSINVTNDAGLDRMRQQLLSLTLYTAEDLKGSEALRHEMSKQAGVILKGIGDAYKNAA